jgi:hypothetical protein
VGHEDAKVVAEIGSCARARRSRASEPSVMQYTAENATYR